MLENNEIQIENLKELNEYTESEIMSDVTELEREVLKGDQDLSKLTGLAGYIRDVKKYRFLTKEEQDEVWRNRTPSNIERLINSHLRLVIDIVNQLMPYSYRNEPNFMDLIQAGNIGLMHAVENFDPSRNVKFITYAHGWIRTYVHNELNNIRCGAIKKPKHILEAFSTITKVEERLTKILGRTPSEDDIRVALDGVFPDEKITELLRLKSSSILSLDMQLSTEDEGTTLMDCISDSSEDERTQQNVSAEGILRGLNEALDPKMRLIISAHYGLGEFKDKALTLDGIARLLKERGLSDTTVTKERIRQLEKKALKLLKKNPTILSLVS